MDYGIISIVPAMSVLILALITKRTLESLIGGSLIGFIILEKGNFFGAFSDSILKVMADGTIGWIIMVCGLFGSLIALLVKSGGSLAFGNFLSNKLVKGRKSSLITTWILGIVIFIDDYLNALTISTAMKKVTDKFKVSRQMLAYVVDSTAAPICVLIPVSTWAIYVAGLLEESGAAEKGNGLGVYIESIPYMFYAWVSVLIVPLVAMKVIPALGKMKKAEEDAEKGLSKTSSKTYAQFEDDVANVKNPRVFNFILPILVLIAGTWYFGIDAFKGVLLAIGFTVVLYAAQKLLTLNDIFDTAVEGFKTMIMPLGIVVASFILKDVNDSLKLTDYVIEVTKPMMSAEMLPFVTFLSLSVITFATGSFWGVYAVALPIVIPLASSLDANMALAIGAVISSGAFGSHSCFYGDSTVLSASGCDITSIDHAVTQIPYALISAVGAGICFILAGFLI